jgi:hypothetical protein
MLCLFLLCIVIEDPSANLGAESVTVTVPWTLPFFEIVFPYRGEDLSVAIGSVVLDNIMFSSKSIYVMPSCSVRSDESKRRISISRSI